MREARALKFGERNENSAKVSFGFYYGRRNFIRPARANGTTIDFILDKTHAPLDETQLGIAELERRRSVFIRTNEALVVVILNGAAQQ